MHQHHSEFAWLRRLLHALRRTTRGSRRLRRNALIRQARIIYHQHD